MASDASFSAVDVRDAQDHDRTGTATAMIVTGDMTGASTFHREGERGRGASRTGLARPRRHPDRPHVDRDNRWSDTMPMNGVFTSTVHGAWPVPRRFGARHVWVLAAETENASGSRL